MLVLLLAQKISHGGHAVFEGSLPTITDVPRNFVFHQHHCLEATNLRKKWMFLRRLPQNGTFQYLGNTDLNAILATNQV